MNWFKKFNRKKRLYYRKKLEKSIRKNCTVADFKMCKEFQDYIENHVHVQMDDDGKLKLTYLYEEFFSK